MASQNHIVCYKQEKNVILGTSEILIKFKFKNINQMRPGMLRFSIISKLSPNLITLYTTASEE